MARYANFTWHSATRTQWNAVKNRSQYFQEFIGQLCPNSARYVVTVFRVSKINVPNCFGIQPSLM